MFGMEAPTSVKDLFSSFGVLVRELIGEGNLNVNFCLLGEDGDGEFNT